MKTQSDRWWEEGSWKVGYGRGKYWGKMLQGRMLGERCWEEGYCGSVKRQADKKSESAGVRRKVSFWGLVPRVVRV